MTNRTHLSACMSMFIVLSLGETLNGHAQDNTALVQTMSKSATLSTTKVVKIDAFFETTDGSAQIGSIVERHRAGKIKFQFCDGTTVDLYERDVRKSEADCAGAGGKSIPLWQIVNKNGDVALAAGSASIPCDKLSPQLKSAILAATTSTSMADKTGYIFSSANQSSNSVTINDGSSIKFETAPSGCNEPSDVKAFELKPWKPELDKSKVIGVYAIGGSNEGDVNLR